MKSRDKGAGGGEPGVREQGSAVDLPEDCPIKQDAETIGQLSRDMVKALRKLRRDLENCNHCNPNCPFLREYHATVNAALVEIAEEWHLQV
jgi:hypothetical protein